MSNNQDKMDSVNEAFGMLLSVWSNYFDDPADFFTTTRPLMENLVEKYQEAEASAKAPLQTQDTPTIEVLPIDTPEDNSLHERDEVEKHDNMEILDKTFDTNNAPTESLESETSDTINAPTADSESVSLQPNDKMEEDDEIESESVEELTTASDASLITTESQPITVESSSEIDTVSSVSRKRKFHDVPVEAEDEELEPCGKRPRFSDLLFGPLNPRLTLFGSSAPQIRLQLGNVQENISHDSSSEKEAFVDVAYEENSADKAMGDAKLVERDDDELIEPNIGGSDTTVAEERIDSSDTNFADSSVHHEPTPELSVEAMDDGMKVVRDEINGDDTVIAEQITGSSDAAFVSLTVDEPSSEMNIAETHADMGVEEDEGNIPGTDNVFGNLALNGNDVSAVVEFNGGKSDDSKMLDKDNLPSEINEPISSIETDIPYRCATNFEIETVDDSSQNPSDDLVLPRPEMPRFFPSLFGRSVKPDPSPIESPEKFSGVYRTIYKDLLDNVKTELGDIADEEENMEISVDQPLEPVTTLSEPVEPEPEACNNSVSVSTCTEDSFIIV